MGCTYLRIGVIFMPIRPAHRATYLLIPCKSHRQGKASEEWTPIGFRALPSANAAQNPLIIHKVLSAAFCLPCQKAVARKLQGTLQPVVLEGFWMRTTQPCYRKARRTRPKAPKRTAEGLSASVLPKPGRRNQNELQGYVERLQECIFKNCGK